MAIIDDYSPQHSLRRSPVVSQDTEEDTGDFEPLDPNIFFGIDDEDADDEDDDLFEEDDDDEEEIPDKEEEY